MRTYGIEAATGRDHAPTGAPARPRRTAARSRSLRAAGAACALTLSACGGDTGSSPATTMADRAAKTSATTPGDARLDAPSSAAGEVEERASGSGPATVVLGDSITVASWGWIKHELAGYRVRIGAVRGEGLSAGAISAATGGEAMPEVAARFAEEEPAVVVLALGTNDAWSPALGLPAALDALGRIIGAFPADACVVGVTITEAAPGSAGPGPYDGDEARAINRAIREQVDVVVPWDEVSASERDALLVSDGIHTTLDGQRRFAELIAEGVAECGVGPLAP